MNIFSSEERVLLKNCELLRGLSEKNFNTFVDLSQRVSYPKGEVLLEEGASSNYLFIIITGAVELYKATSMKKHLIGNLTKGQSIGEMRVIKNQPCSLTVVTSAPTVALCISLSKLRSLEYYQCYESILDSILNILSTRLVKTNQLAANALSKKKSKSLRYFNLAVITVAALFLIEIGVALYFIYYWAH